MTLNLSLPPEMEAKLRQRAAAAGKDVTAFVEEAVQQKLDEADRAPDPAKLSPAEQWELLKTWIDETTKIVSRTLPPGTFVDDSRESIYD